MFFFQLYTKLPLKKGPESYRNMQYLELEGTHKDHWVQLTALQLWN